VIPKKKMISTSQSNRSEAERQANQMVPIRLVVPREALDVLGFRYYKLGIAENDAALAEAAISEMVQHHYAHEIAEMRHRKN
jgi:hypothetical protein